MSVQALSCAMATRGVSPSEKLLLLALANYADEQMRCWPSQKRLADDTCLSDRTIRTLLAALEERLMISRQERVRSDGSRSTDIITLHFHGIVPPSTDAQISGGAEIISGGVRKPLPGGPETASGLTTFEPSLEPSSEPSPAAAASADPNGLAWSQALAVLVNQGGMTEQAARSFFGGLLKAHGLEARDMLGPIGEAISNRTGDPKAWFKAAAIARDQRRRVTTGPPKRVSWV